MTLWEEPTRNLITYSSFHDLLFAFPNKCTILRSCIKTWVRDHIGYVRCTTKVAHTLSAGPAACTFQCTMGQGGEFDWWLLSSLT